ncbi:SVF1 (YDR346C) [Zygosaccharomyces parabailii]|nr:SVF1 (YDR346C) [Zygosaccharomyces parabailii]CDH13034.1 probable Survival factor 1 [Zygosaccharomyces bailii ISA1307]
MLRWIQGGLSAVTGIAEPEYGSDYIHTVTERVQGKQPYRETTREDMNWLSPDHTNVETMTFYFSDLSSGILGFAQIIHSNIIGLHTQAQFTFRIFDSKKPEELNLWTSTKLDNFRIEGPNFYADNLSVEIDEEGHTYHFRSNVNEKSRVDLVISRLVPGCKVGDNPSTYYGDNVEEPWGEMRHVFWPRNRVTGKIELKVPVKRHAQQQKQGEEKETGQEQNKEKGQGQEQQDEQEGTNGEEEKYEEQEDQEVELKERLIEFTEEKPALSMFVMAFMGMKPHHAAKAWNFLLFHSEKHTALIMEFTTPKSYANTKVSVGIITSDKEILSVTLENDFRHLNSAVDSVGWNVPKAVSVGFNGVPIHLTDEQVAEESEDTRVRALVEGKLENLVERIDVMNEIPNFVKSIVSGVAGTKPYIYQYADDFVLQIDEDPKEKGLTWAEVTFISEGEVVTDESYDET